MEKSKIMLSNRGSLIVLVGIVLFVAGGFITISNDDINVRGASLGVTMFGGVLIGMVFGILYRAEGIGNSLIKPIAN